jgi:2'-5' RNA ligase
MRCFVAIPINDANVKRNVEKFMKEFRNVSKYLKPVSVENLHITLKFLGEITQKDAERIAVSLENIAHNLTKFSVTLSNIGVFPDSCRLRVIWIGIGSGRERVIDLMRSIDKACKNVLNLEMERDYVPHLTIFRVKRLNEEVKRNVTKYLGREIKFGEMCVDRFTLYQSILTSNGPIYRKLKEFKLT